MQPEADVLVLFGATGDLSKKKLFPSLYNLERTGRLAVPVIGVARSVWTDEGLPTVGGQVRVPLRFDLTEAMQGRAP